MSTTTEDTDMISMDELVRRHEAAYAGSDSVSSSELERPSSSQRLSREGQEAPVSSSRAERTSSTRKITVPESGGVEKQAEQQGERRWFQALAQASWMRKLSAALVVGMILVLLGGIIARRKSSVEQEPLSFPQDSQQLAQADREPERPAPVSEQEPQQQLVPSEEEVSPPVDVLDLDEPEGAAALAAVAPLAAKSGPRPLTLQRQAVDAVASGDSPLALQLYEQLEREESSEIYQTVLSILRAREKLK